MNTVKNILSYIAGVFTALVFSGKLYTLTRGWAEQLFVSDYPMAWTQILLLLWLLACIAATFALGVYLVNLVETLIRIRMFRRLS